MRREKGGGVRGLAAGHRAGGVTWKEGFELPAVSALGYLAGDCEGQSWGSYTYAKRKKLLEAADGVTVIVREATSGNGQHTVVTNMTPW